MEELDLLEVPRRDDPELGEHLGAVGDLGSSLSGSQPADRSTALRTGRAVQPAQGGRVQVLIGAGDLVEVPLGIRTHAARPPARSAARNTAFRKSLSRPSIAPGAFRYSRILAL